MTSGLFPYTAQMLGPPWYMFCVSLRNFLFFRVNMRITDPEVDSRLSEHVSRPLVSDSHLFGASPDEYMIWIFWKLTSGIISVCSAMVRQWIHIRRQSMVAFGRIWFFFVTVNPVPEVDPGLVRTWKSEHYFNRDGFFAVKCGIFRAPPVFWS